VQRVQVIDLANRNFLTDGVGSVRPYLSKNLKDASLGPSAREQAGSPLVRHCAVYVAHQPDYARRYEFGTMTSQVNYETHMRDSPSAAFLEPRRLAGRGDGVAMARFRQPAGDFSEPGLNRWTLTLSDCSVSGALCMGNGIRSYRMRPNDMVLVAPGVPGTVILDSRNAGTVFLFDPATVTELIGERNGPRDFGRLHDGLFQDDLLPPLLRELYAAAAQPDTLDQFYFDGMLLTIAGRLDRLAKGVNARDRGDERSLTRAVVTKIERYIDAHLGEAIGLVELATVAALSPFHFARSFKRATGQTPHQFVIMKRIDRARGLIVATRLPLADIAYRTGFSSQAHMTSVFSRSMGVTPGRLRTERK
jgi:AraC family transcriptional regulator